LAEGGKDAPETALYLHGGVFGDEAAGLAHEAHGQGAGAFPPVGFGEEACRAASPAHGQCQRRPLALEPEPQAPVRTAGIVDPIAVGQETIAVPADIEERVPVRTVTRQAGGIKGHSDANMA
jgi:hypothetical protein